MPRKKPRWTYSTGARGATVTVRELTPGGIIYCWEPDPNYAGGYRRYSLKHRDRDAAELHAQDRARALMAGVTTPASGTATLAQLFARYLRDRTPLKRTAGERKDDRRKTDGWARVLGGATRADTVSHADVDRFRRLRARGDLDAHGRHVAAEKRRPVRARTVERDVVWLRQTLGWGVRCGLLTRNPLANYAVAREKNPRRPVYSHERYEKLRAVSDRVSMRTPAGVTRSHLSELLDLAAETGRRISAICQLRYADLRLERTDTAPYGAILWPSDTDKQGTTRRAPLSATARAAIDRLLVERPGVGAAYLFPDPRKADRPITRRLATSWLTTAETLAGVAHLPGGAWHPFRRKWATERKHLPLTDVAAAGGWESEETLQRCYLSEDEDTMLHVVLSPARLRERKA